MLSSKANAALMRLKEIEEKYKMKRREQIWNRQDNTDSSISSVSINPSKSLLAAELKESPRNISKLKLDIKMPDMRFEGRAGSTNLWSQDEEESHERIDEIGFNIAMPLEDKSPRSTAGKQESFASDVTIQENSSIESVLDDATTSSSKSPVARSKTSQQQISTTANLHRGKSPVERIRAKSKKGRRPDKLLSGKTSSDDSSSAKRSRVFEKSNGKVSKSRSDMKSREKEVEPARTPRMSFGRDSRNSNRSESSHRASIIDESIGTMEDGSEIISELSRVEESVADKIEDVSANVPNESEYSVTEIASASSLRHPITKNGYTNDTFEGVSSSTMRSKSESRDEKTFDGNKETIDLTESNVRKIEITAYEEDRSHQNDVESHRDTRVTELVSKTRGDADEVDPDKESSSYLENLERIDANPDNTIVNLPKSPKSDSARSEKQRKFYARQSRTSDLTNFSAASGDKNTSSGSAAMLDPTEESLTDGASKMDERASRKSSLKIKMNFIEMNQQESDPREKRGKVSDAARERTMINVTGLLVADNAEKCESARSSSPEEENEGAGEDESIIEKSPDRRASRDAENVSSVLKKMHKDAINAVARRRASSKTTEEVSESSKTSTNDEKMSDSSFGSKIESEAHSATMTTREMAARREDESHRSAEKDGASYNSHEHNIKKKRRRAEVMSSKSAEAYGRSGSRKENKTARYHGKQIHGLQKQIVELRLQQEREDLQKYLRELKDLKLGLGLATTRGYFSPLEFPKIAEFTHPDTIALESKPNDQRVILQERVLAIRRWLRDQYILYRDYCAMAQAINAHYVPTTVEDAKKTIRELQKAAIKSR